MKPVILIPGIGGSILVNKQRPMRNLLGKEMIHNRWLNVYPFVPRNIDQWRRDMGCEVVSESSGRIVGVKPVNNAIGAHDVGGTKGIKDVFPEFLLLPRRGQNMLQDMFHFRYFHDVCEVLYECGYKDHISLFGVPYDFRMVLDPGFRTTIFEQFKNIIEKSVATNGGKKCVVLSHSLGSVLFKWFLSSFVSTGWIEDHIADLIIVSPPFGGSVASLKTVIFGDFYIPSFHKWYMKELQRNTGIIMCLPNSVGFSLDEELIRNGHQSIAIKDYWKMDHISMKIWRDLYEPYFQDVILKPLDDVKSMKTTVFRCDTVPTPVWYGSATLGEYPLEQKCGNGDGIITNWCDSLYTGMFGDCVSLRNVDSRHTHIICDPDVVGKLLECALTNNK